MVRLRNYHRLLGMFEVLTQDIAEPWQIKSRLLPQLPKNNTKIFLYDHSKLGCLLELYGKAIQCNQIMHFFFVMA